MKILERPTKSAKSSCAFFNAGTVRIDYVGTTLTCGSCNTSLQLEPDDEKSIFARLEAGEEDGKEVLAYYIRCPCGRMSVRIGSTSPTPEDYERIEKEKMRFPS